MENANFVSVNFLDEQMCHWVVGVNTLLMALDKGKHLFGELEDGRIVTYVEKGVSQERADFLKRILEYNGFEVVVLEDKRRKEEDPQTWTVAVTDLTFNPVIAVYQRRLRRPEDGARVTPVYWRQQGDSARPEYWLERPPSTH